MPYPQGHQPEAGNDLERLQETAGCRRAACENAHVELASDGLSLATALYMYHDHVYDCI